VHVDFIKLDVEGAELGVLQGAAAIFSGPSRPAILAEVQDLRTGPWGYAAREIIRFLVRKEYRWFGLDAEGNLFPVSAEEERYDANLVALPAERVREFIVMLNEGAYRDRESNAPSGLRWSVISRRRRIPSRLTPQSYKSWLPEAAKQSTRAKSSPDAS